MSDIAITLNDLGHAYRPGEFVFRHYKAELVRGQVMAILGPNGVGKTTLLRLLLGVKPTEGAVHLNGQPAFVPQLFQVGLDYSALDMVLMGRAKHIGLLSQPSARDEAAALAALDHFALADLAHRPFHQLSGGQRQMVIFARALVSQADILILDEPASALDLRNQEMILHWMEKLADTNGLTIVFTTHHPQHALAVADKVLLMQDAARFSYGDAGEVMTEENLHALYGVAIRRVTFQHDGQPAEAFVPILRRTDFKLE